jgi:plastocyanin
MSTMNRRRFTLLGLGGVASATLVACGNEVGNEQAVNPTMIPGVEGAPPTLVPGTPGAESEEPEGEGAADVPAVEVHGLDTLKFEPAELTAAPGGTIRMINDGVLQHDFAIDEFDGVVIGPLNGGDTGDWQIPDDAAPGDYEFYCSIPGHRDGGMHGILKIDPNAAAPAGADEASPVAEEGGEAPAEAPADGGEAAGGEPIEVDMLDTLKFEPAEITAAVGTVLTIKNAGVLQHDFVIDELGGELVPLLNGGDAQDWTVEGAPGTYEFYCSVPGHKESGMVGTLTIQ